MKNVGSVARLLTIALVLVLAAFVVTGCGDEKKQDTVSADQSQPTADTGSDDSNATKQFESGETVGKAGKVVINSDADFSANQQAVIARVGEFADATADQDYKELCNEILSKAARKIGGDCVGTFSKTGKQLKDFKITVNSVTIAKDGNTAVAKVDVTSNVNKTATPQDLSLIKENGEWRIQILGQ